MTIAILKTPQHDNCMNIDTVSEYTCPLPEEDRII